MVYKKTNGLPDSDGSEVVNHPFKNNFIKLDDLRAGQNIGDISDTYQLARFLDWSNSVAGSQNIACHNFSTASNKKCVLPSSGKTSDGRVIPWDFGGVTLTVPEYNNATGNALTLKQETNLKVAMGGTL
ncbi:MAG: hypothetical protein K6F44_07195, partial [Lachnospiraceae bacterium]|nr:hypothetical protein [Lachnospiraceae bacterium]